MKAKSSLPSLHKLHGVYYTPSPIAEYLVTWAIRQREDRVLDPTCGDGVFILAACRRLQSLNASITQFPSQIVGVDNDSEALGSLAGKLRQYYGSSIPNLFEDDFFAVPPPTYSLSGRSIGTFDVVVGNPPFIRYHHFNGPMRKRALLRASEQGVRLSGLASSWAHFVTHASGFLSERGRLAMVLPAELLQVDYALPIRNYLCKRFSSIVIIAFDQRVFEGVLTDALLVLAEKGTGPGFITVERMNDLDGLQEKRSDHFFSRLPLSEACALDKWTLLLLDGWLQKHVRKAFSTAGIKPLRTWGRVDIGIVTGKDSLFIVPRSTVEDRGIEQESLTPILTSGRYLKGTEFTTRDFEVLLHEDKPVFLIDAAKYPGDFTKTEAYKYLERKGLDAKKAYKCRIRNPWYVVPNTTIPDAFMMYMAKDIPRLVANRAKVTSTNTVHRLFLNEPRVDVCNLAVSFHNALTMLSAELTGRSYGGGIFKLETREAEGLLLPADLPLPFFEEIRAELDAFLRRNEYTKAVRLVDSALTRMGRVEGEIIEAAEKAWMTLQSRRAARM